jgi:predicted O-methyltransferase YrrM
MLRAVLEDRVRAVLERLEREDAEERDRNALARTRVEPGALIVADNVLSHPDPLAGYSAARQADPTLESLTVPLDRGLELSVVL